MLSLSINTYNFEPNTRLSKNQLLDLENKLENSDLNTKQIINIAAILRDNTLSSITENELNRMIYFLENNQGKRREIESIILRIIMMSVPRSNGGQKRRTTVKYSKNRKYKRYSKKSKLRYQK